MHPILVAALLMLASFTLTPASAVDLGLPGPTVGDADGDGLPEASDEYATPECGCACPVVGGGFQAEAAGQEVFVAAAASCQSGYAYDVGPGEPDPDGDVEFEPFTICYPESMYQLCGGAIAIGD
jgi:hypothetical protein